MKSNTKDNIAVIMACAMVISGMFLSIASFFLNAYRIHESILGYVGEALAFAGCIFGAHMYLKNKFFELRSEFKDELINMAKDSEGSDAKHKGPQFSSINDKP